jgi:hypothetical protein
MNSIQKKLSKIINYGSLNMNCTNTDKDIIKEQIYLND